MKPGDKVTIEGVYRAIPNPDRRWWQFWKPRMVDTSEPMEWTVVRDVSGRP